MLEVLSNWTAGATGRQSKLSVHRHFRGQSGPAATGLYRKQMDQGVFKDAWLFTGAALARLSGILQTSIPVSNI